MRLRCTKCDHQWNTKKETMPSLCPHCKYSLYYHKPIVVKK